jgi:hypothetical protein
MRHLFWIAATVAMTQAAPFALARSDNGSMAGAYNAGPGGAAQFQAGPLDLANCGTPDDPKPCGPMPRRALSHYPDRGTH